MFVKTATFNSVLYYNKAAKILNKTSIKLCLVFLNILYFNHIACFLQNFFFFGILISLINMYNNL